MEHNQLILNFSHPELSPDAPCYENHSNYEILNKAGNRFVEVAQYIKEDFEWEQSEKVGWL